MLLPLVPPHTRFILQCACPTGAAPVPDPAWSVTELAAEARRQQVAGLVWLWATGNPAHPTAAGLARELAPQLQADAVQALALVAATRSAVARLAQDGIRAIALKGPLLSRRYYSDYSTRHASDVDLLVARATVQRGDAALRRLGYRRVKPQRDLPEQRFELYLQTQHEFGYVDASGAISLELHWRYADCPQLPPDDFEDVWHRADTLDVGGCPVRVLGPGDTFVQLAIHGAFDGWWRGKWIADLPRVHATIGDAEMDQLKGRARQGGYDRLLELALALSGAGAPAQPWIRVALDYVATRLRMPHPRELSTPARLRHRFASQRYFAAMLDAAPVRRAAAYCDLIMPADFDALPLPDALTPLLPYLARGRRALARLAP